MDEKIARDKLRRQHKEDAKKIVVLLSANKKRCNIIFFFKEEKGPNMQVRLFRSKNGLIKLGEKGKLRLYNNCSSYYLSLYRSAKKCLTYGSNYYKRYNIKPKYVGYYLEKYIYNNLLYPLRLIREQIGWKYLNAQYIAYRRYQESKTTKRIKKDRLNKLKAVDKGKG